jgi:hypothetical protein
MHWENGFEQLLQIVLLFQRTPVLDRSLESNLKNLKGFIQVFSLDDFPNSPYITISICNFEPGDHEESNRPESLEIKGVQNDVGATTISRC